MNSFRSIRQRLGLSQAAIADALGVTQSNVSFYENEARPQTVPPAVASKLIELARSRGLAIGFDHVYGAAALPNHDTPPSEVTAAPAAVAHLTQQDVDRAICGPARPAYAPRTGTDRRSDSPSNHRERAGR
jgi:putative transcriptional regulator